MLLKNNKMKMNTFIKAHFFICRVSKQFFLHKCGHIQERSALIMLSTQNYSPFSFSYRILILL